MWEEGTESGVRLLKILNLMCTFLKFSKVKVRLIYVDCKVGSEHLSVDDKLEEVERSVTRLEDVHRSVTQFTTDRSTSVLDNMNQK